MTLRYALVNKAGKCPLAEAEVLTPEATTSKAAPPQKSFASASSAAEKGSWAAGTSAAEKVAKAHQSKLKKEAQLLLPPLQNPEPKKKQSARHALVALELRRRRRIGSCQG